MQTWAKRGIQSALVTGGLLMLGTGIASAQENVNPDASPSPLDARVKIPVDVAHNNVGTPHGNRDLPEFHREIGTEQLAGAVPAPVNPLLRGARERLGATGVHRVTRGNTVDSDIVVPVSACGNAIAAGGDAYAEGRCARTDASTGAITTDGSRGSLAGNVTSLSAAVPVQAGGNAVSGVGNAESRAVMEQQAAAGGDITTSGRDSSLSGNVVAGQWAVPVQFTDNAVAGAGNARADSYAAGYAVTPGSLKTDGDGSSVGGNALGVPLAPIVAVNGNGLSGAGNADVAGGHHARAEAGTTRSGIHGIPTWLGTSGEKGTLAGNALQPQLAGPVVASDNATSALGNSDVRSGTSNHSRAGGFTSTSGQGSTLSGNLGDAPVALPVSGGGNALSGLGNTTAGHTNDSRATAGGGTFTNGDGSVLSSNTATTPPATAVDLCGNGVSGGGLAVGGCENTVSSEAGGYNASRGNDSVVSGNIGQVPLATPVEGFGNGLTAVGQADGSTTEHKLVRSGDTPNSKDDDGTISSNVVSAPTALGAQGFGNAGALVGNPTSDTGGSTVVKAGGSPEATGKHGSLSGNILHVPTSNPAQKFGSTAVAVGNGSTDTDNKLFSTAGGKATSTGDEGSLAGNVLSLPAATSPQVFGTALGAGSNVESDTSNNFRSVAGDDVTTSGDRGSWSGNGLTAQSALPLQVFGDTATVAGNGKSRALNWSDVISGGDHRTSAQDASMSGNLLSLPLNAQPGAFGDAVAVAGLADSRTANASYAQSGGRTSTEGSGAGTAQDTELPVEKVARVYDVPVDVLGTASTQVLDDNLQRTGEDDEHGNGSKGLLGIDLPVGVDSLMGVTELPRLTRLTRLDRIPLATVDGLADRPFAGTLPLGALPVGALPVGALPVGAHQRSVPTLPVAAPVALPLVLPVPGVAQPRSAVPAMPALPEASLSDLNVSPLDLAGGRQLPALSALDATSILPRL
ncbi:hypothetical protein JOF41_006081 [Saccharothrix coeruleofusca]|uniref:beta strand repeat-containing protein n=1 Tax=Saccharothrix coeruleofusca TaxID=33919 RepID=UPI001AE54383|nr:hypothetical protein [Saccharothrix coeruleofusca]MBP2339903.1 hypothetical protein [Saccharothrix coeruleofusca]